MVKLIKIKNLKKIYVMLDGPVKPVLSGQPRGQAKIGCLRQVTP